MIKQHERLILRICALYTDCCRSELCDLYQDAVCAMWESFDSFRHDSKPSTWIYSVTRYTMLNIVRKRRLEVRTLQEGDDIVADSGDSDLLDELRDAVALLQPDERDVFVMWMEGFKIDEIAQIANLNYGTVATRITRIKTKLKDYLKSQQGGKL